MTIGDLARRTGVAVKVLRRQQDLGLIYTRGRSPAGYRLFDENALWCVRIVRGLRDLGLTEAQIQQLARHCDDTPGLGRVSRMGRR
jgi:DNA-binding transcriptional MerR regulator